MAFLVILTGLGVKFGWMGTDGYGEISITKTETGTIEIDSEYMSKEFCHGSTKEVGR